MLSTAGFVFEKIILKNTFLVLNLNYQPQTIATSAMIDSVKNRLSYPHLYKLT